MCYLVWLTWKDSYLQSPDSKSGVLPIDLQASNLEHPMIQFPYTDALKLVGNVGFEPTASSPQTMHSDQAELIPEI